MIPTPQTGKMIKLDPETFQGMDWQIVTDNQAIKSVLKGIGVKDDDYRCVYVLTGDNDTVVLPQVLPLCLRYGLAGIKYPAMAAPLSVSMTEANLIPSTNRKTNPSQMWT
jgi:hypothetical protein